MTLTVSPVIQTQAREDEEVGVENEGGGGRWGGAPKGDNWSRQGSGADWRRCRDPTLAIDTTDGRRKKSGAYLAPKNSISATRCQQCVPGIVARLVYA